MTERFTFSVDLATAADGDGMTVRGLALPFETETADARRVTFAAGSVSADAVAGVPMRFQHETPIGVVTAAHTAADGIRVTGRIAASTAGRDAIALLEVMPRLGMSVSVDAVTVDPDDPRRIVSAGRVLEVSLVDIPAFPDAQVSDRFDHEENPTMETDKLLEVESVLDLAAELDPIRGEVAELRERTLALAAGSGAAASMTRHPSTMHSSLGEFAAAVLAGSAESFALADQISGDNPGVMTARWADMVKGIIDRGRPTITAAGVKALPASGLEDDWAYYDGNLATLVGEQVTEKTEVTTAKVSIKKGTVAIKTYAGASDISIQLLERSSPSYLDSYMRIMALAYAAVTEAAFLSAIDTAATGTDVTWPNTAGGFGQAVREASYKVMLATGQPATAIAVDPAAWVDILKTVDADGRPVYGANAPSNSPTSGANIPGALDFNGVSVFPIAYGGIAAAGLAFNGLAAGWAEDGPRVISHDVAAKLGRDVAIYGYGAAEVYIPAGVVPIVATA